MTITELVRLLDADPELGRRLDDEHRPAARRHLVAEVVALGPGASVYEAVPRSDATDLLGLLVLEGLLVRRVAIMGENGVELLGAGDLVRPWQVDADLVSLPTDAAWTVGEPTRLAILDEEVQMMLLRFPSVLRELVARLEQRANTLALAQMPRLEARMIALLWHLADRFGRVAPTGVVLPVRLSHATLAGLVHARRPSVTSALKRLSERGLLTRHGDGRTSLHGEPPSGSARGSIPPVARLIGQTVTS